jgi:hypothetical protein
LNELRARQQALVAELGQVALRPETTLERLLEEAVARTA